MRRKPDQSDAAPMSETRSIIDGIRIGLMQAQVGEAARCFDGLAQKNGETPVVTIAPSQKDDLAR